MKKKILTFGLVLMMLFAVAGCSGSKLEGRYVEQRGKDVIEISGKNVRYESGDSFYEGQLEETDDGYKVEIDAGPFWGKTQYNIKIQADGSLVLLSEEQSPEVFLKRE